MVELDQLAYDLFIAFAGVIIAKAVDVLDEWIKKKTSKRPGKHFKRSK